MRPAPYEESERFISRVLEVRSAEPMQGVSDEGARTRLGEIKKLILSLGASLSVQSISKQIFKISHPSNFLTS